MDCQSFQNRVFAYAEGSLSPGEKALCDSHAASCSRCAAMSAHFGKIVDLIEAEKAVEPAPFAATRLLQKVESSAERKRRPLFPRFGRYLQPAMLTLAVLVALFIGISLGRVAEYRFAGSQDDQAQLQLIRDELNVPENAGDEIILFDN